MSKTFKIVNGDISDGYHTFKELYDHRNLLFIAWMVSDGCPGEAYWVADHFEGWDLICCKIKKLKETKYISYHVPTALRHLYSKSLKELGKLDHYYDGHTSDDVIKEILNFIDVETF